MSDWVRKTYALRFQVRTQRPVIVNLAVEDDDDLAVGARHRLRGAIRQIDDGKPAMAEADAAVRGQPFALAVGAARRHVVADGAQLGQVDGIGGVVIGVKAGKAAHFV